MKKEINEVAAGTSGAKEISIDDAVLTLSLYQKNHGHWRIFIGGKTLCYILTHSFVLHATAFDDTNVAFWIQ